MRPDKLFLQDILCCCDEALGFVRGHTKDEFASNDLLRSAVQYKLMIVGEAAARISSEFRIAHPEIPWKDVAAYRNFSIHGYFNVNWQRVWDTVEVHVPLLRRSISSVIEKEFPD